MKLRFTIRGWLLFIAIFAIVFYLGQHLSISYMSSIARAKVKRLYKYDVDPISIYWDGNYLQWPKLWCSDWWKG